jgi:hypothetical protein
MNYFFLDFYTAWYAASLVNRMVAIEQGVIILALALVASVVLSARIAKILRTHEKSGVSSGFERRGALYAKLVRISLLILIFYIAYSRIVAGGRPSLFAIRGRLSTECSQDKAAWHQLQLWPDSIVPASIFLVGCL